MYYFLVWNFFPSVSYSKQHTMAAIKEAPVTEGKKAGVRRMNKANLRIDMTPMVDLGFLLIAFFVMTTEMSKPAVTKLVMPKEDPNAPPITAGESTTLTVVAAGNNRLYYYEGMLDKALADNKIVETGFSVKEGLGKIIRNKQAFLDKMHITPKGRGDLMVLIKATADASYDNVINLLDEMMINGVKKYALVKVERAETDWIKDQRP